MSEYQYYEFLSSDRALSPRQMSELRRVSSRAEITPYRFTNHYEYGDFKGDPSRWMERYFDGFLYFANWNTRVVSLRVPRRLLALGAARRYCRTGSAAARVHGPWLILDFLSEEEEGDCSEEPAAGCLGAIIPVREALAAGDHRLLFLGWLLSVQAGEAAEDDPPPCPPGLGNLTEPLAAFADYMAIDPDLLSRATASSPSAGSDRQAFRRWARALSHQALVRRFERLVLSDEPFARAELLAESRRSQRTASRDDQRTASRRGGPRSAHARALRGRR